MTFANPMPLSEMPAPETPVLHPSGEILPAMFTWGSEGTDFREIARDQGFAVLGDVHSDLDDDELAAYERDPDKFMRDWQPGAREGWVLAGKSHTEDGPCALYLKPLPDEAGDQT